MNIFGHGGILKHSILHLLSFEFTLVHQLALEYLQVFKSDMYIYILSGSYFRILLSLDYSPTQMKRANIKKDMLFLSVTDKQRVSGIWGGIFGH